MAAFHLVLCGLLLFLIAQDGESKTVILIGGGTGSSNAVWDRLIDLSGGSSARIGVISAASSTPEDSANYYTDLFVSKGAAESIWIPIHEGNKDANSDPDVIEEIERMTGFYFSGGDQSRIINSFFNDPGRVPSPALIALQETYEQGAVMSGDSAGAAAMGQGPMLTGGYSWEACVYGAYEMNDPDKPNWTVEYDPDGGIGMIRDFIVDTHFSDRGREGRLARLIADTMHSSSIGVQYGIGVDEGTSLIITGADSDDAWGEVVPPTYGYHGVTIFDLSEATEMDESQLCWHMKNIVTHHLTEGDRIHLVPSSFEVQFASYKENIIGDEFYTSAITSNDVFGGNDGNYNTRSEWPSVPCRVMDTADTWTSWGRSRENNPRYNVDFHQDPQDTEAEGGYGEADDVFLISFRNVHVDISPNPGDENDSRCAR